MEPSSREVSCTMVILNIIHLNQLCLSIQITPSHFTSDSYNFDFGEEALKLQEHSEATSQTCKTPQGTTNIYRTLRHLHLRTNTQVKIKKKCTCLRIGACSYLFLMLIYLSGISPSLPRYDPFHQSDDTLEYTIRVSFFLKVSSRSVRPEKSY